MLTLDETTLFFWNVSNRAKKPKHKHDAVSKWADTVQRNAKADGLTSKTQLSNSSITSRSVTPALTNQTTATGSSSVRTSDSRGRAQAPRIVIKPEPQDDGLVFAQDDVIISDLDERIGEEHEDAMKSPPKGSGVRLGSEVCCIFYLYNLLTLVRIVASGGHQTK